MDAIAEKHQRQPDKLRNLGKKLETDSSPKRFDEQLKRIAKPPPEKGD